MPTWDDLEREFFDLRSVAREHSKVSGDNYRRVDDVIAAAVEAATDFDAATGREPSSAPTEVIAKLIVEELDEQVLREIVADWLEGRGRLL